MHLVKVPENQESTMLQEFVVNDYFTFEGMDISNKESLKAIEKLLLKTGYKVNPLHRVWYWFKGSVMNEHFGLTDENAYNDDLTFLIIPDYYNPMVKLQIKARWFSDIVMNNALRQREIDERKYVEEFE
jgi:hypothetical protein